MPARLAEYSQLLRNRQTQARQAVVNRVWNPFVADIWRPFAAQVTELTVSALEIMGNPPADTQLEPPSDVESSNRVEEPISEESPSMPQPPVESILKKQSPSMLQLPAHIFDEIDVEPTTEGEPSVSPSPPPTILLNGNHMEMNDMGVVLVSWGDGKLISVDEQKGTHRKKVLSKEKREELKELRRTRSISRMDYEREGELKSFLHAKAEV